MPSSRPTRWTRSTNDEEREFEEHLASCERCREELAGLREAAAGLAYGAAGPAPPPELKQRILDQARAERPNVIPLPQRRRWTAPLAAAAAAGRGRRARDRRLGDDAPGRRRRVRRRARQARRQGDVDGRQGRARRRARRHGRGRADAPARAVRQDLRGLGDPQRQARAGRPLLALGRRFRMERPVPRGAVVAVTLERAGGVDQPTTKPLAATEAVS